MSPVDGGYFGRRRVRTQGAKRVKSRKLLLMQARRASESRGPARSSLFSRLRFPSTENDFSDRICLPATFTRGRLRTRRKRVRGRDNVCLPLPASFILIIRFVTFFSDTACGEVLHVQPVSLLSPLWGASVRGREPVQPPYLLPGVRHAGVRSGRGGNRRL